MEVLNDAGDAVFEAAQPAPGKPLDWDMRDAKGKRISPGVYTVIVGYTTSAGRPRKRVEQVRSCVSITEGQTSRRLLA
jgi:hypothetical protein